MACSAFEIPLGDEQEAQEPLRIEVTDAGQEYLLLHRLLRQAVPILHNPASFPLEYCQNLAKEITAILGKGNCGEAAGRMAPPWRSESDYEPGEQAEEYWS